MRRKAEGTRNAFSTILTRVTSTVLNPGLIAFDFNIISIKILLFLINMSTKQVLTQNTDKNIPQLSKNNVAQKMLLDCRSRGSLCK